MGSSVILNPKKRIMRIGNLIVSGAGAGLMLWCGYLTMAVRAVKHENATLQGRIAAIEKRVEALKQQRATTPVHGVSEMSAGRGMNGGFVLSASSAQRASAGPSSVDERGTETAGIATDPVQREFMQSTAYGEVRKCLAQSPESEQQAEILMKVNSEGKVSHVLSSSIDPNTAGCIERAAKLWAPPRGTSMAQVRVAEDGD